MWELNITIKTNNIKENIVVPHLERNFICKINSFYHLAWISGKSLGSRDRREKLIPSVVIVDYQALGK